MTTLSLCSGSGYVQAQKTPGQGSEKIPVRFKISGSGKKHSALFSAGNYPEVSFTTTGFVDTNTAGNCPNVSFKHPEQMVCRTLTSDI